MVHRPASPPRSSWLSRAGPSTSISSWSRPSRPRSKPGWRRGASIGTPGQLTSLRCTKTVPSQHQTIGCSSSSSTPTVSPLMIPLVYCHINRFQRASGLARPSQGGEKRIAAWAAPHEERCSARVVAPPVCDHLRVLHRWVVFDGCNPSTSTVNAGRDAAARARRAERAVDGGVASVLQALYGLARAPRMPTQRVAQFEPYRIRNYLPPKNDVETYRTNRAMTLLTSLAWNTQEGTERA